MTEREITDRELLRDLIAPDRDKHRSSWGLCGWCGRPTPGRTCSSHRDVELVYRGYH